MSSREKRATALTVVLFLCALAPSMFAATFAVRRDGDMVRVSDAIVIATAEHSRTELRNNVIETITLLSVEEVIKGSLHRDVIEVYEPGGVYEKRARMIPGIPRFADGERYVLFLTHRSGVWRVADLVLGKFTFRTDALGHEVLLRDAGEIAGWDPDGKPHVEKNREAQPFLDFLRAEASGGPAREDQYWITAEKIIDTPVAFVAPKRSIAPLACTSGCSPTTYTFDYSGAPNHNGARWTTFPATFKRTNGAAGTTATTGAMSTAMDNGMAAWNNDPSSSVSLVDGGDDTSGTHTGGVVGSDGQSTVAFEHDLTVYGGTAITCTPSSYSGTLGVGSITNDAGTHVGPNGETFFTATEGDVEMAQGLATCTFFINLGDFNSAVAHELGHAIGFRHADKDRNTIQGGEGACTDPTYECSTSAIMKSYIPSGLNAALQTWDQHAVAALYPNVSVSPVSSVEAHATTNNNVHVSWSGACSPVCHVYRSADRVNFSLVALPNPSASPFDDTTVTTGAAYVYKVRNFNGTTESTDSNTDFASAMVFTNDPVSSGNAILATYTNELHTATDGIYFLAHGTHLSFTSVTGQTIKAQDILDMRTDLDDALTILGGTVGGYANAVSVGSIPHAADIQELRTRVK